MSSSRALSILDSLPHGRSEEPVRVQGLLGPARSALLSRLVSARSGIWLVLCADAESAQILAEDAATLGPMLWGEETRAAFFPAWESSPYGSISPSLRTRAQRIALLHALRRNGGSSPLLLFTTPQALHQRTLAPATLRAHTLELTAGQSMQREQIALALQAAGYAKSDTVEDPGTFAMRGEIVDVFAPEEPSPWRIEFFDQEIERIRTFDPRTQRGAENSALRMISIPPAREVLLNAQTLTRLREQLKSDADERGISKAQRDPILASLGEGFYPPSADFWAPYVYADAATLWDHLPESTRNRQVVWVDELGALQAWDEEIAQLKRDSEERDAQALIPLPDRLFSLQGELDNQVRAASALYVDQLELANTAQDPDAPPAGSPEAQDDGPKSRHRTQVFLNADLTPGSRQDLGAFEPKFQMWKTQGFRVVIVCATQSQLDRVKFLLEQRELRAQELRVGILSEGFRWPAEGVVLLTDAELLGTKRGRVRRAKASAAQEWSGLQNLTDLSPGDAVVHVDHGIGRYQGLSRLALSGASSDFLLLEYANKDKLYLPVYRMNVIQKYVGAGEGIALDRLGGGAFAKAKEKVREAVRKLAFDLVELYAQRKLQSGVTLGPRDSAMREFEAKFPFEETPDQLKAIDETLEDLNSGRVMDRLICGDVGYGKTEVAMRAAFKAIAEGKQVAVLVPTTVLATQHELSFKTRFKDWPARIESVSRFKSPKDQKAVLNAVTDGKVDILIGTHRLLSRDVRFKDLGLVIVDEEHRFGVEHKEKLKTLRLNTHVLTLSATPIPRTLHMALSGLREITLMNTPPLDRLPIRTYVSKPDEDLIRRAIEFELKRGGQVFYLHNRVQSIYECATRLKELVPGATVTVGHGQMAEGELEEAMMAFYEKRAQILVCTSIIESGLDVPSANTLIVERADLLGLAQLYQIRGRVGRGQQRGYAYLLIPSEQAVTGDAKKRLEVIQRFVELGSGFSIASHDLEIRGGGDLLGAQQSGHINAVGFDLYTELLDEAIREIQGRAPASAPQAKEPEIKVPFAAYLGEEFIPDVHQRLSLYRRLSSSTTDNELEDLETELRERFGPLPAEAQSLLWLIRLKQLLKRLGLEALTAGPERVSLVPGEASALRPERAVALISAHPKRFQLTPDSKLVVHLAAPSIKDLYLQLDSLLKDLAT